MPSGLFDRHPGIQIILGHLGELQRQLLRHDQRALPHTRTLFNTISEIGVDRVMFSADYPYETMEEAAGWFDTSRALSAHSAAQASSAGEFSRRVQQANAYMLDAANGRTCSRSRLGTAWTPSHVLGEFAELSAVSGLRSPLITIAETGEQIAKTSADQIAVIGTLTSGVTASVHVREGVAGGTGFWWEINGTGGTLRSPPTPPTPESIP